MNVLVTGAAGFIGSSLCRELLGRGHHVRGVDCFTPYYDPAIKHDNVAALREEPEFSLITADLRNCNVEPLLHDVDVVYHLAGQPGVRLSWERGFALYSEHNILTTQRLLEAVRADPVRRFVYASSSSVYGNAAAWPTSEADLPQPHSPYGVTKLAGEHLCGLYAANWNIPTVALRYFTVYGPRQRPDMAIHRILDAAVTDTPFELYGTGEQIRDFTYVGDVVRATRAAGETPAVPPGTIVNVAGGSESTMNDVLALVEEITGRALRVTRSLDKPGDVWRTGGEIRLASALLGWKPEVDLPTGIDAQFRSQLAAHEVHAG